VRKILKFSLFFKAAITAIVVLILKYLSDRYGFSHIVINTLTSSFFAGVFFTISILFTAAITDFKEAEKIPGELAVLLKALHNDAKLTSISNNDCSETKDITCNVEDLLGVITKCFRNNYWHKSLLDQQMNHINEDIAALWKKNINPGILLRLRENLTNIDRLSHRIDYIAYEDDIPGAYIVADIALGTVFLIFVFAQNDWGVGGLVLFGAITFVLSSIMLLIHDMDNPFEYDKNTLANVDFSVLFELEKHLKTTPIEKQTSEPS
jgi:predicted membrane chloride channel (bestrophin family)